MIGVLVSIGRRPNTEGLALDKAGLTANPRGQIETDHEFRTSVPGIWAIGDVIPGPMLAHKAEDEGIAVAENIAGLTGIVNHDVIPSVVYTMPEIAGVGLTEAQAREHGEVKIGKFPMLANSSCARGSMRWPRRSTMVTATGSSCGRDQVLARTRSPFRAASWS